MPVETKLALRGLSRDVNGYVADQAGALRKAENVVLRAQDTAESRPNFDMYYESVFTSQRCKALVEFGGEPIAVEYDGSTWGVRRLSVNTTYPNGSLAQPVNYDQAEPQFAEAKKNLYGLGVNGVVCLEAVTDTTNGFRYAGLEMLCSTDLIQWSGSQYASYSWAYQFVFMRTDSNGNINRSVPSERIMLVGVSPRTGQYPGTRFYFPSSLKEGDRVEAYRSRTAVGSVPNTTMYLAWSYALTNADIAAGYFTPPIDDVADNDLGVELYTNSTQQGVVASKYAPPRAQAISSWQRCMWYGRTQSKNRLVVQVLSVGQSGIMSDGSTGAAFSGAHYTLGSTVVDSLTSTAGLAPGMKWSDNYLANGGPSVNGTFVPAGATIANIINSTSINISTTPLIGGTSLVSGVMTSRPNGPFQTNVPLTATFTSGSAVVTNITSTAGMAPGHYITDSLVSGPTVGGAKVQADSRILTVDGPTQVTMTKTASASGAGVSITFGSVISITTPDGTTVPFYAFRGVSGTSDLYSTSGPWSWPAQSFDAYNTHVIYGQQAISNFITSFTMAVNYYAATHQTTFRLRAIPLGDLNRDFVYTATGATGFALEEVGVGRGAITLSMDSGAGADCFAPQLPITSTTDDKPNRLWWSNVDEPEGVPLLNYQDIGSSSEPILALVPLRNALLVFKTDGIWRVTGSAPSSWSIEPLDLAIRLLRPEAVTNIGDGAYAWCDRGMFLVTDSGAQSLSSNAIDVELRTAANYILTNAATHGTFMVPWKARNLVLFGIPAAAAGTTTQRVYAFSTVTNAFSEWPASWSVACHGDGDAVYYSRPYDGTVLYEVRKSVTAVRGYDRLYVISSATAVGTTVTISQAITGAWEPAVGDILTAIIGGDPTYGRRITAVASGGGNWTLTIESAFPAGSTSGWTAYEVPVITLEWHPAAVSGLPMGGFCREMQVHLDLRDAGSRVSGTIQTSWALGGTSEAVTTPSTITSTRALTAQIQPIRVGMSRKVARGAALAGYFSAGDLFPIRVLGASLVFDGTSERTRK